MATVTILDWGFWILDWNFTQRPIQNPKSKIQNRTMRLPIFEMRVRQRRCQKIQQNWLSLHL